MKTPTNAFPLKWPSHYKRTRNQMPSRFGRGWNDKPTIAQAVQFLRHELELMGCQHVVISSNLRLKNDGFPYSQQTLLKQDCGVAVYFTRKDQELVIACDQYDKPGCNITALAKTVESLRGIERWGCSELLNQAFAGFKALPERTPSPKRPWNEVLGVRHGAAYDEVRAAYKALVKTYHPDNAQHGDRQRFDEVQDAWNEYDRLCCNGA